MKWLHEPFFIFLTHDKRGYVDLLTKSLEDLLLNRVLRNKVNISNSVLLADTMRSILRLKSDL